MENFIVPLQGAKGKLYTRRRRRRRNFIPFHSNKYVLTAAKLNHFHTGNVLPSSTLTPTHSLLLPLLWGLRDPLFYDFWRAKKKLLKLFFRRSPSSSTSVSFFSSKVVFIKRKLWKVAPAQPTQLHSSSNTLKSLGESRKNFHHLKQFLGRKRTKNLNRGPSVVLLEATLGVTILGSGSLWS